MKTYIERSNQFLKRPLDLGPRVLLLLATLLLVPAHLLPLWRITVFAPEHPDGLRLQIYSEKVTGEHDGQDIGDIGALYGELGTKGPSPGGLEEFKWIHFVVGALGLLFLRAAFLGSIGTLLDVTVLYLYFGLFSLWSFGHMVAPFLPPLIGQRDVTKVAVHSYPAAGSYALAGAAVALVLALGLAWREGRAEEAAEARVAG